MALRHRALNSSSRKKGRQLLLSQAELTSSRYPAPANQRGTGRQLTLKWFGPPNPRLQRTRVARFARPGSPLSRKPLGDPK
jgi:hypothetical protein